MNHPAVSAVAADPRLLAIAAQFLGDAAIPYKATPKPMPRRSFRTWSTDSASYSELNRQAEKQPKKKPFHPVTAAQILVGEGVVRASSTPHSAED